MALVREPVYSALFALLSNIPGVVTASRTLKHWNDVPASMRPALFQSQKNETAIRVTGIPTKWILMVDIYVYVSTQGASSPGAVLNPILDAIVTALAAPFPGQSQTLGGLAHYARIEGVIETDEGTLGNEAVAIIPVMIETNI